MADRLIIYLYLGPAKIQMEINVIDLNVFDFVT